MKKSKKLSFKQAVHFMSIGYKVKRKTWLKSDYIYMDSDFTTYCTIYCDGGFAYITYLKNADFKANDWEVVDV